MDVGALSLLISEKGFDATMQKVAALDVAAGKLGAKPAQITVTAPAAAGVQAALQRVAQTASTMAGSPVAMRLVLNGIPQVTSALAGVQQATATLTAREAVVRVSAPATVGVQAALAGVAQTAGALAAQPAVVRVTTAGIPQAEAVLAGLAGAKASVAAPVVIPVTAPNTGPALAALVGLDAAKAHAGAPVTIPVTPPVVASAVAALGTVDAAKARAATPLTVPVAPLVIAPAVAGLAALGTEKSKAGTPVVIPVVPPNIAPTLTALGGLEAAKAQAGTAVAIPIVAPSIAPAVAALGGLDVAKARASTPVVVPVAAPNVTAATTALGALAAEKARVSAVPVTTSVIAPNTAPVTAALTGLEPAKQRASTPVTVPVLAPNIAPAVAGLGGLDAAKAKAAAPVTVLVTAPNVAPSASALGGLASEKARVSSVPVTTAVTPPNVVPAVAALGTLAAEKAATSATPVTTPVVAPSVAPVVAALSALGVEKARASVTPVTTPVAPPLVGPATAALGVLATEKAAVSRTPVATPVTPPNIAPAVTALAGLGAEKQKAGTPITIPVTPPSIAPAIAGLAPLDAAKTKASAPIVIPVAAPQVAPAVTALGALEGAKATARIPVTVAVTPPVVGPPIAALGALAGAAAAVSGQPATVTVAAAGVAPTEAALAAVQAKKQQLGATPATVTVNAAGIQAAVAGLAQTGTAATAATRALAGLAPAITPAAAAIERVIRNVEVMGAAVDVANKKAVAGFINSADAAASYAIKLGATDVQLQRIGVTIGNLEKRQQAAGGAAAAMTPKVRSASNALSILAFSAATGEGSLRGMTIAAGLASSSLLEAFGPASIAAYASGIGAAVVILGTLVAVLHDVAKAAPVAQLALDHIGNLDRISSAQSALSGTKERIAALTEELGRMDTAIQNMPFAFDPVSAGVYAGAVSARNRAKNELEQLITIKDETQKRLTDVTSEQSKALAAASLDAAVSAAQDQLAVTSSLIDRHESLNAQGYALGLVNLRDYFDTRVEIAKERSAATIAALEAERRALSVAPVAEKPDERIQRVSRRDSVSAQLEAERTRARTAEQAFMAEREAAERGLAQRIAGYEAKRLEAQGKTHDVRMQQIDQEVKEFERTLAVQPGVDPATKAAQVNALREALTLQEKFNNAQRESGRIFEELALEREVIHQRVAGRQLTEEQGAQAIAAAERARLPALQKIATEMERFAKSLENPELIAAAKRLNAELGRLKIPTLTFEEQWFKDIEDEIKRQFKLLRILLKPENIVLTGVEQALGQLNQQLSGLAVNVGNSIGAALAAGFSAAFTKDSGKSLLESFGNAMMAGIGGIMVQLGSAMLTYGLIMAVAAPLLAFTPFANQALSAPVAIIAGTALIAAGAGLGAIASNNTGTRTGGGGGARASAKPAGPDTTRVVLDPDRRLREARAVAPTVSPNTGARAQPTPQPVTFNAVIIGPNDLSAQRQVGALVDNAVRRGLIKSFV